MGINGSSRLAALVVGVVAGCVGAGCKASLIADPNDPPRPSVMPVKPTFGGTGRRPVVEPAPQQEEKVEIPGAVVFLPDSDKLDQSSDVVLELVKKYLDNKPDVTLFRIEGHTDWDGDDAHNQTLSEHRAMSVAHWLTTHGIDCKRLIAVGFGESKPVADNRTEEGKAQNRRVVYYNAAHNDKPVGGMPVDGGGVVAGDPCK